MIKVIKLLNTLCIGIFLISHSNAQVHKYSGSDGSVLLSNKSPVIKSNVSQSKATAKDLKPENYEKLESQNIEYTYQGTTQSIATTEKLHVAASDVYKPSLCKVKDVIIPCYSYDKTVPAATYNVPSSKMVKVDSNEVLKEAQNKVSESN